LFDAARRRLDVKRAVQAGRRRTRFELESELKALANETLGAALPHPLPLDNVVRLDYRASLPERLNLYATDALRVLVARDDTEVAGFAVAAAARLFVVEHREGMASAIAERTGPLSQVSAILLSDSDAQFALGLKEFCDLQRGVLPVYGPEPIQRAVDEINDSAGWDDSVRGLQAWGPAPEPGRSVIVFEGDGLIVSAFTSRDGCARRLQV
jgi:hypothetical protein